MISNTPVSYSYSCSKSHALIGQLAVRKSLSAWSGSAGSEMTVYYHTVGDKT